MPLPKVKQKIAFAVPGSRKKQSAVGLRFSPDGKRASLRSGGESHRVIDTATKRSRISSGRSAFGNWLLPGRQISLHDNGVSNDVSVIDVASLKVVKRFAVVLFRWAWRLQTNEFFPPDPEADAGQHNGRNSLFRVGHLAGVSHSYGKRKALDMFLGVRRAALLKCFLASMAGQKQLFCLITRLFCGTKGHNPIFGFRL